MIVEDFESEMSESSVLGFISDVFIEDFVSFILINYKYFTFIKKNIESL